MRDTVEGLQAQLKRIQVDSMVILNRADSEQRDPNADERKQLDEWLATANGVKARLADLAANDAQRQQILALELESKGFQQPDDGKPASGGMSKAAMTYGRAFTESPLFREWAKSAVLSQHLSSPAIKVAPFLPHLMGRKDLLWTGDETSAGAFLETDYTGIYEPLGRHEITVLNLFSAGATMMQTVEWVVQTVNVQEAAQVPESNVTIYTGATGQVSGEKPEGKSAWVKCTANTKITAVWLAATKNAIADVPALRTLIDNELRSDITEKFEDQLLTGDGVGENHLGVFNYPGHLQMAFDTDILRTTRIARTNLRIYGRARPTAFVMNPLDWQEFDLKIKEDGSYYWGGPMAMGQPMLWGVPVVESEAIPVGQCVLADWRKGTVWTREAASISMTDSHEDFFVRNMIAVLAEQRAAFGLIRPQAFMVVDLTAGS